MTGGGHGQGEAVGTANVDDLVQIIFLNMVFTETWQQVLYKSWLLDLSMVAAYAKLASLVRSKCVNHAFFREDSRKVVATADFGNLEFDALNALPALKASKDE